MELFYLSIFKRMWHSQQFSSERALTQWSRVVIVGGAITVLGLSPTIASNVVFLFFCFNIFRGTPLVHLSNVFLENTISDFSDF